MSQQILIIGSGSVARVLGALLKANRVHFFGNYLTDSYIFKHDSIAQSIHNYQLEKSIDFNKRSYDCIFWCTSTTKNNEVFKKLLNKEKYSRDIFVLQNGVGYESDFKQNFSKANVHYGVVKFGAKKTSEGVHLISEPLIALQKDVSLNFENEIEIEESINIEIKRLEKLSINCVINPITAILGINNGNVLKHPEAIGLTNALIDETFAFWKAKGVYLKKNEYLRAIRKACLFTENNKSSMLSAIENNQKLEIESILTPVIEQTDSKTLDNLKIALEKVV